MKKLFFVFAFMLSLMTIKAQEMVVGITTVGSDSVSIGIDFIPVILKVADSSDVYIATNTLSTIRLKTKVDTLLAQSAESWVKVTLYGATSLFADNAVVLLNRSQILRMTKQSDGTVVIRMKSRRLDIVTDTPYDDIVIDVVDGL